MRTRIAVLIGVGLLHAPISNSEPHGIPTVEANTVTLAQVRRGSAIDAFTAPGGSRDALLVERPAGAREDTPSSVFVLDESGVLFRRVPVVYGRASASSIRISSGVAAGERIIVSDMRAWDAFDRLRAAWR